MYVNAGPSVRPHLSSPWVSSSSFSVSVPLLGSGDELTSPSFLHTLCLVAQSGSFCSLQDSSGNGLHPSGSSAQGESPHKYIRVVPCLPFPGYLPKPWIKLRFPTLQADYLPSEPQGKPNNSGMGSLSFLRGYSQPRNWTGFLLPYRRILYQLGYHGSL